MITNFQLKFGRVPGATGATIAATPVTVFVGPNNSGKSRILQEIERYCRSGQKDANSLLLADLEFCAQCKS
jgi:predicted ATPase